MEEEEDVWPFKRRKITKSMEEEEDIPSRKKIPVTMIVLYDGLTDAIGTYSDELPWTSVPDEVATYIMSKVREPSDPMKRNGVIIGRNMFQEVMKEKCIPGCLTGVLSTRFSLHGRDTKLMRTAPTFPELYKEFEKERDIENIYVIGGAQTFQDMMPHTDFFIGIVYNPPEDVIRLSDAIDHPEKSIRKGFDYVISFRHRFAEIDRTNRIPLALYLDVRFFDRIP